MIKTAYHANVPTGIAPEPDAAAAVIGASPWYSADALISSNCAGRFANYFSEHPSLPVLM
jgi:hypothetical protein